MIYAPLERLDGKLRRGNNTSRRSFYVLMSRRLGLDS
jgi:hypothetical protein